VQEVQRLIQNTRTVSYRVFYFTLYSLGLRLGDCLRLQVGDIDAQRQLTPAITRVRLRTSRAWPCSAPIHSGKHECSVNGNLASTNSTIASPMYLPFSFVNA
jgi:hypothetical protein